LPAGSFNYPQGKFEGHPILLALFFLGRLDMLDLSTVEPIAKMGGVITSVLQLIYNYSEELTRISPVTVQWIPLSQEVCNYKLVTISSSHLYRALNWLVGNGYLEKKQFDETNPYCRCKLFKLTDKFYDLLKGITHD
jgi:hypothetical protein